MPFGSSHWQLYCQLAYQSVMTSRVNIDKSKWNGASLSCAMRDSSSPICLKILVSNYVSVTASDVYWISKWFHCIFCKVFPDFDLGRHTPRAVIR